MPLFDRTDIPQDRLGTPLPPDIAASPNALDVAAASLRQSSTVGGIYEAAVEGAFKATPPQAGYDPLDDIDGYEEFATRFLSSRSPQETATIKSRIQSDLSDRRLLGQAGGWGTVASLAAGLSDPINLAFAAIPLAGEGRLAGLVRGAVGGAVIETPIQLAQESLHPVQTRGESILNVGTAALLTGILGSAVSRSVPRGTFDKAAGTLAKDTAPFEGSTTGAAQVGFGTTLEEEGVGTGGGFIAKTLGRGSPLTRLLTSFSKSARVLAQKLADIPYVLKKNESGIATGTSVEKRIEQYNGLRVTDIAARDAAYLTYRDAAKKAGNQILTREEFSTQVAAAMRRGDAHSIPEVAAEAARTRRTIIDPITKEAQALGQLPKELELVGAKSYLPRLYHVAKIKAHLSDWMARGTNWLVGQGTEPAEAKAIMDEYTNKVLGTTRGFVDLDPSVVVKSGPLRERTVNIPDEILEPYLHSNIERVVGQYLHTVAPQIELARGLGVDAANPSIAQAFENEVNRIKDEYAILKERSRGNDKRLSALTDREKADIRDAVAMRDRILGKYGIPEDPDSMIVRGARLMRTYTYIAKGGAFVLASFGDIGRIISRYGMTQTAAAVGKFTTRLANWGITRADAKRIGAGTEWALSTRGRTWAEIGDFADTRIEEVSQKFANQFTRVSGMATWNSTLKFLATALEQDSILKLAQGGKLGKNDVVKLAETGIDRPMLARIGEQFKKYGETHGLRRGRTALWDDKEAASVLEQALLKQSDIVVLTPGRGDAPLFMSKELFKTLFQFKGFGMAAVNRLLIPAAQGMARGDLKMLNGMMQMLALGSLAYVAKQFTADQPIDTSPWRLMAEAVDKSGFSAYLSDPYDIAADISGLPRLSRFSDRSWIETAAGPALGTAVDIGMALKGMLKDGVSQKDIHKIRKLLPYQNLWYARRAINWMEDSTVDALGIQREARQ